MNQRLGILTSSEFSQLYFDDHILVRHLIEQGFIPETIVWTEPSKELPAKILVRTPWDYFQKHEAFIKFLETSGAEFFNPASLMLWNLDKNYLTQLKKAGVPIVPTQFFARGTSPADLRAQLKWSESVLKPTISAGAYLTIRASKDDWGKALGVATKVLAEGDLMAQPFCAEVLAKGEISLIYFNDTTAWAFSHAVLKKAKEGDFRVQALHGGSIEKCNPTNEQFTVSEQALAALPSPGLYARVDLLPYEGKWVLAELELVEPELFFRYDNAAPKRLCNALLSWC